LRKRTRNVFLALWEETGWVGSVFVTSWVEIVPG